MAVRKIAISVPEDVLRQVDRMAKKSGTTRSGFITLVLSEVSHAGTQTEITERINRLFEDKTIADEQAETASFFLRAAERRGMKGEDDEW